MKPTRTLILMCINLLVLVHLSTSAGHAQAPEPVDPVAESTLPELSRTVIVEDGRTPNFFPNNTLRWTWRPTLSTNVDFVRLHIRAHRFSAVNNWTLVIKNNAGEILEEIRANSFFGDASNREFWTKRIEQKNFRVELLAQENPVGLDLEIDKLIHSFFMPGPRAITTGRDDMKDLVKTYTRNHTFYTYSQPIAAIFFVRVTGVGETNCTGFLLTPEVLITNQHCISQSWQLNDARVIFNYEKSPPRTETFGINSIIMQSASLDFTLLQLDRPANWPIAKISLKPISPGQHLVVIQHPNKKFKMVSEIDCVVEKTQVNDLPNKPDDFYHLCDTGGGASGSPVMERSSGRVVGLHHLGISDAVFNQGRNLAVNIGAVLDYIRPRNQQLHARILQFTQ